MFISEDGTVTGSVDVSRLGQVEPKTDEAKAQHEALTRELQAGQEQAARDAERASQGERAVGVNSTGRDDGDDDEREKSRREQADAERQQKAADEKQAERTKQLQAEAEAAGVTVDKRWGADRLQQELDAAKASGKRR